MKIKQIAFILLIVLALALAGGQDAQAKWHRPSDASVEHKMKRTLSLKYRTPKKNVYAFCDWVYRDVARCSYTVFTREVECNGSATIDYLPYTIVDLGKARADGFHEDWECW